MSIRLTGQQVTDSQNNVGYAIASPTAAVFSADKVQVNLSTGAAGIDIPLTSLAGRSLTLPVSLSYQSNGVRVGETASWVGLGWALNAGGVITRVVKGFPDEMIQEPNAEDIFANGLPFGDGLWGPPNGGYLSNGPLVPNEGSQLYDDLVRRTLHGKLDLQPDEFYFNFLGRTGMFVFGNDGNPRPVPFQNLKIEMIGLLEGFVLSDDMGYKYYFTTVETTLTTNTCPAINVNTETGSISGWFLSEIRNFNDQLEFSFHYDVASSPCQTSISHTNTVDYHCNPFDDDCPPDVINDCDVLLEHFSVSLKRIESLNGQIKFVKQQEEREDLGNEFALKSIEVFNGLNSPISAIKFTYDYTIANLGTKRLRLRTISNINTDGESWPPIVLDYNDIELPYLYSTAQDHWGFFNGFESSSLIPNGTSRHPNPVYTGAGMLESISSPTGAKVTFQFESNTYGTNENGPVYVGTEGLANADVIEAPDPNWEQYDDVDFFTLDMEKQLFLSYSITHDPNCSPSSIRIENSFGEVVFFSDQESFNGINASITVPAGTYTVFAVKGEDCNDPIYNQGNVSISIKATPFFSPSPKSRFGGGMRIKSISSQESQASEVLKRTFSYQSFDDPERSSGYLLTEPVYSYYQAPGYLNWKSTWLFQSGCPVSNSDYEPFGEHALTKSFSYSISPLQMANGGYVLYTNVSESTSCNNDPSCENGRIEYEYSLFPTASSAVHPAVQNAPLNKSWRSGNLLKQRVYSASNQILSESLLEYNSVDFGYTRGLKGGDTKYTQWSTSQGSAPCKVQWNVIGVLYYYSLEQYFLEKRTDIVYDAFNPAKFSTSITNYSYDDDLRLVELKVNHVESDLLTKEIALYPKDYVACTTCLDSQAQAINFMRNQDNRVWNVPVEKISLRKIDGSFYVIAGEIYEFELINGKLVQTGVSRLQIQEPILESAFTFSNISNGQFNRYFGYRSISKILSIDANLRTITSQSGLEPVQSVLRDYPDGKVVAHITNAHPSECAYTSFETNNGNGWIYNSNACVQEQISHLEFSLPKSYTGKKSFQFLNNSIQSNELPSGKYRLTFWSLSATPFNLTISSNTSFIPVHQNVQNNHPYWKYNEYIIDATSDFYVIISGTNYSFIDELRLYPHDAILITECFNEDGTSSTVCDQNSVSKYHLYDAWKRIEWTLDQKLQIVVNREFHLNDLSVSGDLSWIKTKVVLAENLTKNQVVNAPASNLEVATNISYLDGYGREIQSVSVRQSPMKRDIVQIYQYDGLGREAKKFLPFTIGGGNNGTYVTNPETSLLNFYNISPRVVETSFPFAEVIYEKSPLSRIIESGNFGEAWQINSGSTIKVKFELNDQDEILLWKLNIDGASAMSASSIEYHPANSLTKYSVTDENGQTVWEYKNVLGQIICRRVQTLMSGEGISSYSWYNGIGQFTDNELDFLPNQIPSWRFLDYYFIYDDFGQLIYEVPAIAVIAMSGNYQFSSTSGSLNYTVFDGYILANRYDLKGRLIESKMAGESWSRYVYNNLDQLIATQKPSSSLFTQEWEFAKYDVFGRIIQSGLFSTSLSRQQIQDNQNALSMNFWESKTGNPTTPYTNVAFPLDYSQLYFEKYYDDYQFNTSGFAYNNSSASRSVIGKVTGEKILVLDNSLNQYIRSVNYYNQEGLLTVYFKTHILGGFEKVESFYDYQGRPTQIKKQVNLNGTVGIIKRFEYDHAGRITRTFHKIGTDEEVMLSKHYYNELGQLVKKHLHITDETNAGMQIVDYRYNERGWLTKINNAELVDDGDNLESWDVFGEEIIYHDQTRFQSNRMEMISQYNGNIAAIKWKTNRNPEFGGDELSGHSYVYRYDALGQMTGAFYAASFETYIDNYSNRCNMWDETISYDSNGNLLNINRNRGINDQGVLLTSPLAMDRMTLSYSSNSNFLISISDYAQTQWIPNEKYTHFIDGQNSSIEYSYDKRGRLIEDLNKGLSSIEYNKIDLVSQVNSGSEQVSFVWDAAGNKLSKTAGNSTIYYIGEIEYSNNVVQSIATSEGLARCPNCMLSGGDWKYDYYLTDHLGNVRAVITEEESEIIRDRVTVEIDRRSIEDANFENVSLTEKEKPYLYPYDSEDPYNLMVSELSSFTGKVMGPAKVMEVKQGERIDLSTKYWYQESPGEPLDDITEILAGTIFNLSSASVGVIPTGPEMGMALLNNVNGNQFSLFNNFINSTFDGVDFSKPQAYLVYMTFDKNMTLDPLNSGAIQVGNAQQLGLLSRQGIQPRADGYFYTYVTNKSQGKVSFNNLEIVRWAPKIRAVYDYYPYGLTWENPTVPNDPNAIHDRTAQSKEFQFSEFSTSRGLALLDFHARMYDPCIARWSVPDPAYQFFNPYLAMGNNPVSTIDPDGEWAHIAVGALFGGVVNWVAHGATLDSEGLKAFAIGALAGGVGAATLGVGTAAAAGLPLSTGFTGGAALAGAAGTGGFLGGGALAVGGTTASNLILSEGNHMFLGDPRWSNEQFVLTAAGSFVLGGSISGYVSWKSGNGFWRGSSPSNSTPWMASGKVPAYKGKEWGTSGSYGKGMGSISHGQYVAIEEGIDFYYRNLWASGHYIDDVGNVVPGSWQRFGVEIIGSARTSTTVLEGAVKSNYGRFLSKIPANSKSSASFQVLDDGNYLFQATSPGKVLGSSALYQKWVNPHGETVKMIKTTFAPDGSIIHIKPKL